MLNKKFKLLFLILISFIIKIYAQEPIVSITMDSGSAYGVSDEQNNIDSIAKGISGEAVYFAKDLSPNHFVFSEKQDQLSALWKDKDFSVELWVQTKACNKEFQVIASNKDWNSGEIKDYTDNRYAGWSRTSGVNKGWAIICQSDGSWAWNIGNGKHDGKEVRVESFRKDYRPTAPRQQINDGEWHQIAFSINRAENEARLYFDGQNVAIYYMGPVKDFDTGLPVALASDPLASEDAATFNGAIDEFKIYDYVISSNQIADNYKDFVPAAKLPQVSKQKVDKLNLMSWNIWHGGRRRGRDIGPQQVIDLIKDTGTDIVMMQETYGSGPLIADELGYYFYLSSENISVISKYPIEKTWVEYHELWTGITTIQLSEKQKINLASIWLHYLPGRDTRSPDMTAEKLIEGEAENRHKEIKIILEKLKPQLEQTDDIPLFIGGDFNSPSHNDWGEETKNWHNGLVVEWPVSKEMWDAGFTDSFREIHPDLNYLAPTISAERLSYRIDYIYYKGKGLKSLDSDMHYEYKGIWPSDHPAVTTIIQID